MSRACTRARRGLLLGDGSAADHLAVCPRCAGFADKLASFRSGLAARHAGVTPPAGFAAAVRARRDRSDADGLGWAMWRLLPATVALVLLLAVWTYRTPSPLDMTLDPDDDLLSWVVADETALP